MTRTGGRFNGSGSIQRQNAALSILRGAAVRLDERPLASGLVARWSCASHDLEPRFGPLAGEIRGTDQREEQRGRQAIGVHLVAERQRLGRARKRGELLGRRVQDCPCDEGRLALGRHAEIEQDRMQLPGKTREKDVLGLDVLVTQPRLVQRIERAGDGEKNVVRLFETERSALESVGERLPLVDRHRQPHVPGRHAVVLQLDDVRMARRGEHDELALDVASRVHLARNDLESDLMCGHVHPLGDVHSSEHPLTEHPNEAIVAPHDVADLGETVGSVRSGRLIALPRTRRSRSPQKLR